MAGTSSVSVGTSAYVSLGTATAGMYISPEGPIEIVASASQPAANAVGHPIDFATVPFFFSLNEQIWAIAINSATTVIVSI